MLVYTPWRRRKDNTRVDRLRSMIENGLTMCDLTEQQGKPTAGLLSISDVRQLLIEDRDRLNATPANRKRPAALDDQSSNIRTDLYFAADACGDKAMAELMSKHI